MPRYEYECAKCKMRWEIDLPVDKRTDPQDDPCPECGNSGKGQIRRLMNTVMTSGEIRNAMSKMPDNFKENMNAIKKANPEMRSTYF